MTKHKNKIPQIILILALCTSILLPLAVTPARGNTLSAEVITSFESTSVLDDLNSATINGKQFNITDYPFAEAQDTKLLTLIEYCYSYSTANRYNYGLYLYIYNPKALSFNAFSNANKAQLAVAFNPSGEPTDYDKFNLKYCGKTTGDYTGLFYKFKIIDKIGTDGKRISERVNSLERKYYISGIELQTTAQNAKEYNVGTLYTFTGYASGYGPSINAESTLQSTVIDFETIHLDVNYSVYRTGYNENGKDHQNQVNTVYFSVPERFFDKYGRLQRIMAEWYEYKTQMIAVTSNLSFYNDVFPHLGVDTYSNYLMSINRGLVYNLSGVFPLYYSDWSWNTGDFIRPNDRADTLSYLFYREDIKNRDYEQGERGRVEGSDLYNHMLYYTSDVYPKNGYIDVPSKYISKDLFLNTVDEGRQMGYNRREFDVDTDLFDLLSYNDGGYSWWDKVNDFGFWTTLFDKIEQDLDDSRQNIPPIEIVDYNKYISMDEKQLSKELLIDEKDVSFFKSVLADTAKTNSLEGKEKEKLVIFRFAATDYFSAPATTFRVNDINYPSFRDNEAYLAQQTIFFDFDIIHLTFNKDGNLVVIPVVSSPIDIIGDITPPLNWNNNDNGCLGGYTWKQILGFILVVILLIVFLRPIIRLLSLLWDILKTIAKLIIAPFKRKGRKD